MGPAPALIDLLAGRRCAMHLDEAALAIAALDHQPVDDSACLRLLDEWAESLGNSVRPDASGAAFLSGLNQLFFGRLGFQGDSADYHNPANSCLDLVLGRRKGLPITLSVVYMELARRLRRPVEGLALPAHFICRFIEDGLPVYIDVFHGGALMTEEDCVRLISGAVGQTLEFDPGIFPAASPRVILHRMLNNLRNSYLRAGNEEAAGRLEELQRRTLRGEDG